MNNGSTDNHEGNGDNAIRLHKIGVILPRNVHQQEHEEVRQHAEETLMLNATQCSTGPKYRFVLTGQRIPKNVCNFIKNIVWGLVVVSLTSICLLHSIDRIRDFLSEPTSFQINVNRPEYIKLPAVTICPAVRPNFTEFVKSSNASNMQISVEDVWNKYAISENDVEIKDINSMTLETNKTVTDTLLGRCITLSRDNPMKYQSFRTGIIIDLVPRGNESVNILFGKPIAAMYALHDKPKVLPQDLLFLLNEWRASAIMSVKLTPKRYSFMNLSKAPCYSEADFMDCQNMCFMKILNQNMNCRPIRESEVYAFCKLRERIRETWIFICGDQKNNGRTLFCHYEILRKDDMNDDYEFQFGVCNQPFLPFMKSKWPNCTSVATAEFAFKKGLEVYYTHNWFECDCKRQCNETVCVENKKIFAHVGNTTMIILRFTEKLLEEITENEAFKFTALVSEVGGGIGIFLGISVYSLYKFLEKYLCVEVKEKE